MQMTLDFMGTAGEEPLCKRESSVPSSIKCRWQDALM
jgi:hypothetical protein